MSAVKSCDYIIVGQGLAGSALAMQMLRRRRKIMLIEKPARGTSSIIAAGIFNPVTGKKMAKTWMADELFPYLKTFYGQVEQLTSRKLFVQKPIYRPFLSVAEQNEWITTAGERLGPFLRSVVANPLGFEALNDPFGGLIVDQGGYVDTAAYLNGVRESIRARDGFCEEEFSFDNCRLFPDKVVYRDVTASAIIFCEGVEVSRNPYFNWLPVVPLKGEILSMRGKFFGEMLVNRGVYIVPAGENEWRVGATYEHNFDDPGISASARDELLRRLKRLVTASLEVTGHYAGIRPTTPDRRPILGMHPECPAVYIFNGLGTKGVSLSPYFSEALLRCIEDGRPLAKEVDISRYYSLYWKSR